MIVKLQTRFSHGCRRSTVEIKREPWQGRYCQHATALVLSSTGQSYGIKVACKVRGKAYTSTLWWLLKTLRSATFVRYSISYCHPHQLQYEGKWNDSNGRVSFINSVAVRISGIDNSLITTTSSPSTISYSTSVNHPRNVLPMQAKR